MQLHLTKRYVWADSTCSKSKFIVKNIDLKLIIFKILSIIFIIAFIPLNSKILGCKIENTQNFKK